jgi:hypothetical protein
MTPKIIEKTEVSISSASQAELNDKLKKALQTIDKKLRRLHGGGTCVSYKAPPNFKYNELDGNTINLQNCVSIDYLIKSLAKMKRIKLEYNDTLIDLDLRTAPSPMWCGILVDNWIHDLELRCKIVGNAAQIEALNKSKADLETFLSQEDRLRTTLETVSALLK